MKNRAYQAFLKAYQHSMLFSRSRYVKQPEPGWCVESCFRFLMDKLFNKEHFITPPHIDGLEPIEMKILAAAYGLVLIEEADYIDNYEPETVYLGITYLNGVNHSVLLCYHSDTELALTVYDPAKGSVSRMAVTQLRVNRLYRLYAAPRMATI